MNKLRVAVIGAGAAGLCAARHMAARPDYFEPVVFEKSDRIGGTWVYTEDTGTDKNGLPIHSSMYASLKTNLPKEVMLFPDFPFKSELPSFIGHTDVLEYLELYAQQCDLSKYIKFCRLVQCVRPVQPVKEGQSTAWQVTVRDLTEKDAEPTTALYDAVIICNGHHALPKIPDLNGKETFPGRVFHSHDYRHPSVFAAQSVVVVGAGPSGMDIALDISPHARQVYLSHWKPRLQTPLPDNVVEVQAIERVCGGTVDFADGTKALADSILFCSGYDYDYGFLHPDCRFDVTDGRVTPLYKHLVHTRFPSLSVIGITIKICPFPHFDAQIKFVLASLDGSMKLPDREEMEAEEERRYQAILAEGKPHRYAHMMADKQWNYNNELLRLAGYAPQKPVIGKLYRTVHEFRQENVCNYKKRNFQLIDDESFEQLQLSET